VPTHDEQRVRNSHCNSITCNDPNVQCNVRHVDGAKRHIRRHAGGNMGVLAAIPRSRSFSAPPVRDGLGYQPCRTQLSGGSDADCADG
jgi:hypothetical protein